MWRWPIPVGRSLNLYRYNSKRPEPILRLNQDSLEYEIQDDAGSDADTWESIELDLKLPHLSPIGFEY